MGFYSVYKIIKDVFRTVFGNKGLRLILIILTIFLGFIIFNGGVFALTQNEINAYTNLAENVIDFSYFNDNGYAYCMGNSWQTSGYIYYAKTKNCVFAFYDYSGNVAKIGVYDKDTHEQLPLYVRSYNNSTGALNSVNDNNINGTNNVRWNGYNYGNGNSGWFASGGVPIVIQCTADVYRNTSFTTVIKEAIVTDINPYFITTDEELATYDFDYLQISGGTFPYYTEISDDIGGNADLILQYNYKGVTTNIDLTDFITVTDNKFVVNVPYNYLTNYTIVRNEQEFSYVFKYRPFYR